MTNFFIDNEPGVNTSWEDWHNSIAYVLAAEQLPTVDESRWQEFAQVLQESPVLDAYGLPEPESFATWQEWAQHLLVISNGLGRQI